VRDQLIGVGMVASVQIQPESDLKVGGLVCGE